MELLAALLAVVALLGTVALVVARVLARFDVGVAGALRSFDRVGRWLAFGVAATATAGSLYFSEIEHYVPCRLCWFQRIFMYPLTIVLLVAAIRRDRSVRLTAVPLAAIGASISVYHVALERGWFDDSSSCDPEVPCSVPWFEVWGSFTLAGMALCGFLAIIALVTCTLDPAGAAHAALDDVSDGDDPSDTMMAGDGAEAPIAGQTV